MPENATAVTPKVVETAARRVLAEIEAAAAAMERAESALSELEALFEGATFDRFSSGNQERNRVGPHVLHRRAGVENDLGEPSPTHVRSGRIDRLGEAARRG